MNAEEKVIGCCLLGAGAVRVVADILEPSDFASPHLEDIFAVMVRLAKEGKPSDPFDVERAVIASGVKGLRSGYLYDLMCNSSSAASAGYYADIVKDDSIRRKLTMVGAKYQTAAGNPEVPTAKTVADMLADLKAIRDVSVTAGLAAMTLQEILDLPASPDEWVIPRLLQRSERLVITGWEGIGKALALDTPIPTPKGWTTMGELSVGQEVFSAEGKPTLITAATEVMWDRDCYRVGFSDGSSIIADGDHLWETENYAERGSKARSLAQGPLKSRGTDQSYKRQKAKARTTLEIRDTLKARNGFCLNHSIETCEPLQYPTQELLVHPYVLGAWLGDGHTADARITIGEEDQEWMHQQFEKFGHPLTVQPSSPITFGIKQTKGKLRAVGVLGGKYVPESYLQSSVAQRLMLIQGLMDSDGTINDAGKGAPTCEFSVVSERLARGVHELILGLGIKCVFREGKATLNGRHVGTRYRLSFQTDLPVFSLPRKAAKIKPLRTMRSRQRFITSVELVESVPVRCISVDNDRHLYLAGRECIPTHNTTWVRQMSICMAAGVNPVTLDHVDPVKTLVVDVENTYPQWRDETRNITKYARRLGSVDPAQSMMVHCGGRMDVRKDKDLGLIHKLLDEHDPDVLFIGPIYKLVPNAIQSDDDAAPLITALDSIRDRGVALVMEAHATKASREGGSMAPRGSNALVGWPEFGFGLVPSEVGADVQRWRGDRVKDRDWPNALYRNKGTFPWMADNVHPDTRRAVHGLAA